MQDCSRTNTLRIYIAGHCFRFLFALAIELESLRVRSVTLTTGSAPVGEGISTNRWFLGTGREQGSADAINSLTSYRRRVTSRLLVPVSVEIGAVLGRPHAVGAPEYW